MNILQMYIEITYPWNISTKCNQTSICCTMEYGLGLGFELGSILYINSLSLLVCL